uniref:Carboxylesterase type B domain-containing protein n=1 Tax=Acrobeloides nanus TaxID=290746 RepID=A0A914CP54_9BILA
MSGSPFAEWAASEYVVEESIKVVKELNCFDSDVNKIKLCMKKISIDELQSAYEKLGTTRPGLSPILYTPRIDDDFLPKTFEELIKEAPRKAILSGFASQEGAKLTVWPRQLVRGQIIPREEQFTYDGNRLFEFIKNYISPEEYFGSEATAKKVQTMVEEFYANDIPQNADYKFWLQKYSQLISDTSINMPQLEEAKLRAEHDWPVYFYQTAYFNYDAIKETFKGDHPVKGAWHLSEYPYLFGFSSLDQFEFNENDWTIQKFWLELVENFVKNGNPSLPGLTWPRISKEKFQFVNVTIEPVVENDLMSDMLTFWKELIENYR